MKVIGYVRVSTDEQVREGASLEAQRHKIKAWTEALDGELLFIAEDAGISGNSSGTEKVSEGPYKPPVPRRPYWSSTPFQGFPEALETLS